MFKVKPCHRLRGVCRAAMLGPFPCVRDTSRGHCLGRVGLGLEETCGRSFHEDSFCTPVEAAEKVTCMNQVEAATWSPGSDPGGSGSLLIFLPPASS